MAKYTGRRIVPKHAGEWNIRKEYEELQIVLDTESGNSYISNLPVPKGTALTDEKYWSLYSLYSEQIAEAEEHLTQTAGDIRTELSETEDRINESLSSTENKVNTNLSETEKYGCVEDSIADHAAYLLGAMNGSKKRYEGLAGCTDYKKAVQIIKDGGYATSHTYVQNLCNIIERWNLAQYNVVSGSTTISGWYRVRKSWQNAASQKGAFHDLTYAKQCADANPGYVVFDPAGKAVYPVTQTSSVPYAVRVSINDLNIRKGPGTNYAKTGQYTGKGVFTIVAESAGAGSKKGWGKLKSGAGWVSLDFCTRVG